MSTQLPLRLQAEQMTYGAQMRAHRTQLKLLQGEVGAQVGVTNSAVSQWERDRRKRPSSKKAAAALEWLRQRIVLTYLHADATATPAAAPVPIIAPDTGDIGERLRLVVQKATEAFPPEEGAQWLAHARLEVHGLLRNIIATIDLRPTGALTPVGYVHSTAPAFSAQMASWTAALHVIETEIEAKDPRNKERRRAEILRKLTVEEQELLGIKPS
ncbi:MAG: hypothetical protein B9S38_02395 [Verrucomicrobiia bacterium Tous-C4TDCM]|nr:MAG: hypothetical protein B9S38_02395 [Verrucomicrobiae bacterium Tous-C4TDCM]